MPAIMVDQHVYRELLKVAREIGEEENRPASINDAVRKVMWHAGRYVPEIAVRRKERRL